MAVLFTAASCAATPAKPGAGPSEPESAALEPHDGEDAASAEAPGSGRDVTAPPAPAEAERPRVLFLIAEKSLGEKFYNFWWWGRSEFRAEVSDTSAAETALKEAFLEKGFRVVDISASLGRFEIRDRLRVADLTREETVSIGRDLDAEVVVYGRAVVEEGPRTPGSNVGVYLAEISAQAVRVDDGEVLAASTGHGAARHVSATAGAVRALRAAGADLSARLIGRITAARAGPVTVTVTLSGVAGQAEAADFKEILATRVRGVKAVYQRKLKGGVAVFEVESSSSAGEMADALAGLPGAGFRVTGTTPGTVEVTWR
ncbi:MAG: hypothetical protein ACE5EI_08725 [Thermodesulfobacteriota bacterium]